MLTPYTTWEQEHSGDHRGEALCDAWNARNAAELARCGAVGPACALACNTPGWVPPSERLIVNEHARGRIQFSSATTRDKWHRSLGYGAVIWCGGIFETPLTAPGSPNEQWTRLQATKRNRNVCRPFDERHAANVAAGHDGNWHNSPYPSERILSERSERHDYEYRVRDENRPLVRVTPPNHGHGAKCGCGSMRRDLTREFAAGQLAIDHERSRATGSVVLFSPRGEIEGVIVAKKLWVEASGDVTAQFGAVDCVWCAGTGRIICDDERAGRVSPSHAAGGYAKWQRRTMESAVAVRSGTRPLGRITNMRSVDGFMVGDIELADGSVVVERLMAER